MSSEQKELSRDLEEINSGRDLSGRRKVTDALMQVPQIDEQRIDPMVDDVSLLREAYIRLSSVSGIPDNSFEGIDPREAFGKIRRYADKERIKQQMLNTALSSMATLYIGADLLDRLTKRKGLTRLCQVTYQVLNEENPRFGSKDPKIIQPVLLGDESTKPDMLQLYTPFRAAIQISLAAERVSKQYKTYRDRQLTSLGRATDSAGKIHPEEASTKSDMLNKTLKEIADMQRKIGSELATGMEAVSQVGIVPINSDSLRGNLQSAKRTGENANNIKKLQQKREELAKYVRNQLRFGQNVHLSVLNSFNFGTLAEFAQNIGDVGETVARISLTDTVINSAVTSTLALRAAGLYLIHGGNIDIQDLTDTAGNLFTSADGFKTVKGGTKYLEPETSK